MPNKALWDKVCVTDPKAVKAITGKQYKGNSPKPYWIVERLTEEFGPCGIGWGFSILNERMEHLSPTDVLHVAVVKFWYVHEGQRGELEQIGQTKAVYEKNSGGLMVDEDAPKKSVTDALVKCASYIGFAGDIFAGRWDDSKYVAWAAEETARRETPRLTDQQAAEIKQLLQDTNSDTKAFLGWISKGAGLNVICVEDMPASAYEPAKKRLTVKQKETA